MSAARQDLPVEGNALPKQAVTGMALGERHPLPQSLQALNRAKTQGSALTTQINQPQPALKLGRAISDWRRDRSG